MASVKDAPLKFISYERITGLSAAKSPTVDTDAKKRATIALIVAQTQAVVWTEDGTTPTATNGTPLATNTYFYYTGSEVSDLKFLEQAASAVLHVTLYR